MNLRKVVDQLNSPSSVVVLGFGIVWSVLALLMMFVVNKLWSPLEPHQHSEAEPVVTLRP